MPDKPTVRSIDLSWGPGNTGQGLPPVNQELGTSGGLPVDREPGTMGKRPVNVMTEVTPCGVKTMNIVEVDSDNSSDEDSMVKPSPGYTARRKAPYW